MLFEVTENDRDIYQQELEGFLPDTIIDIHTHVWLDRLKNPQDGAADRLVSWPMLVARENPVEDLRTTYELLFPGKDVRALCFSLIRPHEDFDALNAYVAEATKRIGYEALLYAPPWWSPEDLEKRVVDGGFLGIKVYLDLSPQYIPNQEIRVFDFLPREYLEMAHKNKWIVMLHIPRDGRLGDEVNLHQMLEIDRDYPDAQVIIAHVGRAYCESDIGRGFEFMGKTDNLVFDFSANTNNVVFEQLINTVGSERVLFGSDLPIVRMRMRRICENGTYVNLVPPGLYGDLGGDRHMREVSDDEAKELTFFLYEELRAFRRACTKQRVSQGDLERIFRTNAERVLATAKGR